MANRSVDMPAHPIATFSIVALDPENGDLGVAVASRFLAVGAVVPHAAAGVGAVATQAWANLTFGPTGLEMLRDGKSAPEALDALLAADAERDARQVAVVDAQGGVAAWTGAQTLPWSGHHLGESYTCQGNILAGEEVVTAMARAFDETSGDLADRLRAALQAGDAAGGDARGRQSAALLVVRAGGGYGGLSDRYIDLRVDDHPDPCTELERLFGLWDTTFLFRPGSRVLARPEGEDVRVVQRLLQQIGYYQAKVTGVFDDATSEAVRQFRAAQGMRDGDWVDDVVLAALRVAASTPETPSA